MQNMSTVFAKEVHIYSNHKNWIVGGIFKEMETALDETFIWRFYPETSRQTLVPANLRSSLIPYTKNLSIFATHKLFFRYAKKARGVKRLLVTQILDETVFEDVNNLGLLNSCERIVVQNSSVANFLGAVGVKLDLIHTFPGAIDRNVFFPIQEYQKTILISGDFKDRKNPELIAKVVQANPDLDFVIHGRNLGIFDRYCLNTVQNVQLLSWESSLQPALMRNASVCLVLSKHEGGPFSILEALSSGTPVVSTDVGFASDLLEKGTGYILPMNPDVLEVRLAIDKAIKLKSLTAGVDLLKGKFTWREYGEKLFAE